MGGCEVIQEVLDDQAAEHFAGTAVNRRGDRAAVMGIQRTVNGSVWVSPIQHSRGSGDIGGGGRRLHIAFRSEQRRHRARLLAFGVQERHPQGQQVGYFGLHRHMGQALTDQGIVDERGAVRSRMSAGEFERIGCHQSRPRGWRDVLLGLQRGQHHRKALVRFTNPVGIGDPHVVVEHDVGAFMPHGVHRPDLDTG